MNETAETKTATLVDALSTEAIATLGILSEYGRLVKVGADHWRVAYEVDEHGRGHRIRPNTATILLEEGMVQEGEHNEWEITDKGANVYFLHLWNERANELQHWQGKLSRWMSQSLHKCVRDEQERYRSALLTPVDAVQDSASKSLAEPATV